MALQFFAAPSARMRLAAAAAALDRLGSADTALVVGASRAAADEFAFAVAARRRGLFGVELHAFSKRFERFVRLIGFEKADALIKKILSGSILRGNRYEKSEKNCREQ